MYSNKVIELFKILKDYSDNLENIIRDNDNEFSDYLILLEIENIINDLKDLDRNIRVKYNK